MGAGGKTDAPSLFGELARGREPYLLKPETPPTFDYLTSATRLTGPSRTTPLFGKAVMR